jgi:hypothetical protein
MVANSRSLRCCFCGATHCEVELLFVSPIGGLPPNICSGCVEGFAAVIAAYRVDANAAALAINAHNSRVTRIPP